MENNKSTGRPWTDHTTVGGQVLAHRFRMMQQNWRIIGLVGYSSFIIFFLSYLLTHWKPYQIWNYLCCLKAKYRVCMTTMPEHMFNTSFMCDSFGRWKEFADYFIAKTPMLINFKAKFEESLLLNLELSIAVGVVAAVTMLVINKYFGKSISDNKEIISGHDYVDAKILRKAIKDKSDITLAEIPYPKFAEMRHTLLTGTTGAGKTNAIIELIDQVKAKGERLIIVDTVGTFVEKYYQDGDIILNPLDPRSVQWSFLSECDNEILLKNVAACLISHNDTHDKFWEEAAQIVFVETAKKVIRENKSTREFIDLLLKVSLEEIQMYLKGTYGYSLMDKRADKMAISIRATLINAVSVFDILKESKSDNFSIRNWVIESHAVTLAEAASALKTHPAYPSKGGEAVNASAASTTMFLSCKPAERTALTPLITAWLSIASEALLQTNPTDKRTWFFIDELHNLKRLPKIETSLAEVRKFGGCFVIGTQMVSQLNAIYGHETAHTITGLCGTKVVMNVPEPETAKYMSGFLGEKEEISTMESISYGANTVRDGVNIAQQTHKKSSVPFNEIMNLKTGEAFVKFSGIDLVTKTKFKLHDHHKEKDLFQKFGAKFNQHTEARKESSLSVTSESNVISLEENVKLNSLSENDLFFYGIPLNDEITSRPIYFFDEDTAQIAKFLDDARSKNKRVVVFEDGSKLYDACFQKDHDILLNSKKNDGYAWDMLGEFDGNYIAFANAIIESSEMNDENKKNAEAYFYKALSNLSLIITDVTTANVLNKLIFQPFGSISTDFVGKLGINDKDVLEKYSSIRDYLSLKFNYLKPITNCNCEISILEYKKNGTNGVLFISCFNDRDATHTSKLIIDSCCLDDVLTVFSSKTLFKEKKNNIIDASEINVSPEAKSTIISSVAAALKYAQTKKIFSEVLQNSCNENSYFAKIYGNEKVVRI